jgi:hypothetical protein
MSAKCSPLSNSQVPTGQTKTLRNAFLACTYLLSAMWGVYRAASEENSTLVVPFAVMMALSVVLACTYDARLIDKPIPHSVQWVMFFAWPLAACIYLIWSRGIKGLWLGCLHAILLYGALLAAYYGTMLAASRPG